MSDWWRSHDGLLSWRSADSLRSRTAEYTHRVGPDPLSRLVLPPLLTTALLYHSVPYRTRLIPGGTRDGGWLPGSRTGIIAAVYRYAQDFGFTTTRCSTSDRLPREWPWRPRCWLPDSNPTELDAGPDDSQPSARLAGSFGTNVPGRPARDETQ